MFRFAFLFLLVFAGSFFADFAAKHLQQSDPAKILEKARLARLPEQSRRVGSISVHRGSRSSTVDFELWTKDDSLCMLTVRAPENQKGRSYLRRNGRVWSCIPGEQDARRVKEADYALSWLSTGFSLRELMNIPERWEEYRLSLLGIASVKGLNCYQVELVPVQVLNQRWTRQVRYISQRGFLTLKIETFMGSSLASVQEVQKLSYFGDSEQPSVIEKSSFMGGIYKSKLVYKHIQFHQSFLRDRVFTTAHLVRLANE
ncbi:MAG: outer membrane lipoprotein-sorting protein [Cytophagales bacterium]|nr:outer membrane lipoprotein-sorting protein [Cytophagales bacterium]